MIRRCGSVSSLQPPIWRDDAETTVSGDLIEWADIVFVMERAHRNKVSKKFKDLLRGKRLVCSGIPDDYERMDPILVRLLKNHVSQYVPLRSSHPQQIETD